MDERLSALRTALDNERQKGQALRSKMDERLSVRRVLSQKFERIGALNVLRWIFNLGAAARRAAGNHGSGRLCHGKKVKARFLPALRLFRASPAR